MTSSNAPHLYLVDGSGYIFRAFHALPPLTTPDGTPSGAVFGYCQMLNRLTQDVGASQLAVIFDAGRTSFRNEVYADYKAHRPEPPPELIPQFALIRDATRAYNLPCIELPGYEADDLIAAYAEAAVAAGYKVTIVSSDKDLMQLVADGIEMYDPIKLKRIGRDEVIEKFGVPPEKVIDVQALIGDPTDNVPGVPGIGVKTAAQLITEYGDLDSLLARLGEIKQPKRRETLETNREKALLSRRLVTLDRKAPLPEPLTAFAVKKAERQVLRDFFQKMGFTKLIQRLDAAPDGGSGAPVVTSAATTTASVPAGKAEKRYELVQSLDVLKEWVRRATYAGVVAFDTETTSSNAAQAELVGVSLALSPGEACYVPLGHRAGGGGLDLGERPPQIPLKDAVAALKPMLEDPSVLKIGYEIKFDQRVMRRLGVAVAPVDDAMLLSFVLDAGSHSHGQAELSERHLEHKTIALDEITGAGKARITFADVSPDKALGYAAEEADVALRLHRELKPRLIRERLTTVYETVERPLVPVLAAMETAGIKVDPGTLHRLSNEFGRTMATLEGELHKIAGREFNVGSPKQLGEILFDELKLPGGKKGKTGAYSTHSDILEELIDEHPMPKKILDWRLVSKLKSTYADTLIEQIDPVTRRIHTTYDMAGAATGRLSSNDPNLQNIPVRSEEGRRIRAAFIAEDGHKLLSVDYSQIELRLVAEMAEVEPLKQAFRDGLDIHALTASQVFGVPLEKMDPLTRRNAKAINFGIIYGMSAFGLARQIGVAQSEASAFIKAYFERYPGIRAYMDKAKETARKHGYVTTLFGRRVHVKTIADKNPAMRSFAERQAINAPIQGTAADIIKRAMIRMPAALGEAGLKTRMLLQVHDELVFEAPDAEVETAKALVRKVMEGAIAPAVNLGVPLIADAGVGTTWAEAH
ncbi:MAG: DNA polymerase I [Alphaproteobacteria bacterium]|nr:DNA polymerase I [Alphaproteobacteria bacterium]